jgi:hypothetical protein
MTPEQDTPLCLSCLHPNGEEAHFCVKCGAPLDSYAATAPFEQIYAEGHAFRSATQGKPSLIVVLGIWILFLPGVVAGIFIGPLTLMYSGSWIGMIVFAGFGCLSAALIYLTTRRYLQARSQNS